MKIFRMHVHHRGQVLLLALIFLGVFTTIAAGYFAYIASYMRSARAELARVQAFELAEAGVDEAVYALNQDASYAGEPATALGGGTYTVMVADGGGGTKRLSIAAYVPSEAAPLGRSAVSVLVGVSSSTPPSWSIVKGSYAASR